MGEPSNPNCCVIELHYYFNDESHSMDALIFNKCEREFLNIIKEVARRLGVKVEIETEALGQGGLLSLFTIITHSIQQFTPLLISIGVAFIMGFAQESGKNLSDCLFGNNSAKQQKQFTELNEKLDKILEEQRVLKNIVLKILCSNYYEFLKSCPKVDRLTMSVKDKTGGNTYFQNEIESSKFPEFIITDDKLDLGIENDNDAIINNIYRIRSGRKYKWEGRYSGKSIRFNFKDEEQNECSHFDEGSTIECQLEIHRKIGNSGRVRNEYEVVDVYGNKI